MNQAGRLLCVVLAVAMLAGCQNNRVSEERNALFRQNRELQAELDRTRAALDASESDRLSLAQDLAALQSQPPVAESTTDTGGFGGIEGVETVRGANTVTVRVPGDVLFAPGKVDLKSTALTTLSQIAGVIKSEYPNQTIRVEGYTDTDPIRRSKWKDNLELSLQRAAAVHRHLAGQGISADRMYAAGFGETKPAATKAKSRRVEIVVVLN